MARLGIPGQLHERRWRNFGHSRSEARGHGDYIWVIDADDTVVGTPDFSSLSADAYLLRGGDTLYWRRRSRARVGLGVRWRNLTGGIVALHAATRSRD